MIQTGKVRLYKAPVKEIELDGGNETMTSTTKQVAGVANALIPKKETVIAFAKLGGYVTAGAYVNNFIATQINTYLPMEKIPEIPVISKPTISRGISALAGNFVYNMIPPTAFDLPFVGKIDVKEAVKFGVAGAFANFAGSLAIDVLEYVGVNVPASVEQAIR